MFVKSPINLVYGLRGKCGHREEPSTSTRRCAQQLSISQKSLMQILNKVLNQHANKVQLIQELETTPNGSLTRQGKSSSATKHTFISVDSLTSRIAAFWANENLRMIVEKPMHPQRVASGAVYGLTALSGSTLFENEVCQAVIVNGAREMITDFLLPEIADMKLDDMWF